MSTDISTNTAPARGLALASFDDAFRFAKMVSASEFAPKDFKGKPESCLLAIQHGSEVGLSPMQSLQSIAVINGRPTIWGDAALALVQSSPVCEYVREYLEGEGKTLTAVCECKRRGYPAPTIVRFSMADAEKAGLAGKSGPWTQYPARMLALRARGFALRNAFADALRGLITAEEAQDYPTPEPLTSSVKATPGGITVHHVESFAPTGEPLFELITRHIADANSVTALGRIADRVDLRESEGKLTSDQSEQLRARIGRRHDQIEPRPEAVDGVA